MLETLDLSKSLTKDEYVHDLVRYQVALQALGYQVYVQQRPVVIVFEGADAGGKGGSIKRVTEKLDPRGYVVHPIAAPQGEDKTHHYLWRFWRRLPELGQIAIFDRSWYGRVMVERIEEFCSEEEWKRAYREINHMERQLVDFGTILLKFYIHISKDEQLRRFAEREQTAYKSWKLTDEDWRNRDRWDAYVTAVNEMLRRTSTLTAPWTVVEGNNKWYARIRVLRTLVDGLSHELGAAAPAASAPSGKAAKTREPEKTKKAKGDAGPSEEKKGRKQKPARDRPGTVAMPMIDKFEFGAIQVDGRKHDTDVVIYPDGRVEPWHRSREHKVEARDLDKVLRDQPEVLIIGTGTTGNLRVSAEASDRLQEAAVEPIIERTFKACELYKRLCGRRGVAALLHVTC
jgi:polyphosphate kinase 2 (PPK2 family)